MPISLWVQLLLISGDTQAEFETKLGPDGLMVDVRKWYFLDLEDVRNVSYQDVVLGKKRLMVAKIGSNPNDMPSKKCWWIDPNTERARQVDAIQMFSKNLNVFNSPNILDIQSIIAILNDMLMSERGNIIIISFDLCQLSAIFVLLFIIGKNNGDQNSPAQQSHDMAVELPENSRVEEIGSIRMAVKRRSARVTRVVIRNQKQCEIKLRKSARNANALELPRKSKRSRKSIQRLQYKRRSSEKRQRLIEKLLRLGKNKN